MYGITAFIYEAGLDRADEVIAKECGWLYDRLRYWEENMDKVNTPWAPFLLKDAVPNKEKLFRLKKELKQNLPE
jgi:hypothetical protein